MHSLVLFLDLESSRNQKCYSNQRFSDERTKYASMQNDLMVVFERQSTKTLCNILAIYWKL